jgi:hypothetical protein
MQVGLHGEVVLDLSVRGCCIDRLNRQDLSECGKHLPRNLRSIEGHVDT